MRQRGQMGILVFAALVGLANCAGAAPEPPPSEPPEPTVSPSVSPSEDPEEPDEEVPTPEPLPLPDYPEDLTAEDTPENAILAAEYFLELMNYIQSTGDVAPFEAVAAESCESCDDFIATQTERYESGGFLIGNRGRLLTPLAERTSDGFAWQVTADWDVSDGIKFQPDEGIVPVQGAVLEQFRIGVQLTSDSWEMLDFAKAAR